MNSIAVTIIVSVSLAISIFGNAWAVWYCRLCLAECEAMHQAATSPRLRKEPQAIELPHHRDREIGDEDGV